MEYIALFASLLVKNMLISERKFVQRYRIEYYTFMKTIILTRETLIN